MTKAKKTPPPAPDIPIVHAPLLLSIHRLVLSPLNPRQDPDTNVDDLIESIKIVGLLQPLGVVAASEGAAHDYEVVYGGRRLKALAAIMALRGEEDLDVPCVLVEEGMAASYHENAARKPLKPSEYLVVFRKMTAAGMKVPAIAKALGITQDEVKRYMKLAGIAPEVLEMVDKGRLDLTSAAMFTKLDPGQQVEVLNQILTDSEVAGDDQIEKDTIRYFLNPAVLSAKFAMFDPTDHPKWFEKDLFDGEVRVTDKAAFLKQQQAELNKFQKWLLDETGLDSVIRHEDDHYDWQFGLHMAALAGEVAAQLSQVWEDWNDEDVVNENAMLDVPPGKRIQRYKDAVLKYKPAHEAVVGASQEIANATVHAIFRHSGGMFTVLPYAIPPSFKPMTETTDDDERPEADQAAAAAAASETVAEEVDHGMMVTGARRKMVREFLLTQVFAHTVGTDVFRLLLSMLVCGHYRPERADQIPLDQWPSEAQATYRAGCKVLGVPVDGSGFYYDTDRAAVLARVMASQPDEVRDALMAHMMADVSVHMHEAATKDGLNALVEAWGRLFARGIGDVARPQQALLSSLTKAELEEILASKQISAPAKKKDMVDAAIAGLAEDPSWIGAEWVWRR